MKLTSTQITVLLQDEEGNEFERRLDLVNEGAVKWFFWHGFSGKMFECPEAFAEELEREFALNAWEGIDHTMANQLRRLDDI